MRHRGHAHKRLAMCLKSFREKVRTNVVCLFLRSCFRFYLILSSWFFFLFSLWFIFFMLCFIFCYRRICFFVSYVWAMLYIDLVSLIGKNSMLGCLRKREKRDCIRDTNKGKWETTYKPAESPFIVISSSRHFFILTKWTDNHQEIIYHTVKRRIRKMQ